MSRDDHRQGEYLRRIHDNTTQFTQTLLAENASLRAVVATLQSEKTLLEDEVHAARRAADQHQAARKRLEQELGRIGADGEKLAAQYAELEQQHWQQLNLYVASYRLHGTLDREELLATIQEIIANLVGCEEMAVFECDPAAPVLRLVASTGIDTSRYAEVTIGEGPIGQAVRTGELYVAGDGQAARGAWRSGDLTACVPLRVDGRVIGALALFRLLQQKAGFEAVDRELFELLATHAATALYCTGLHERAWAGR